MTEIKISARAYAKIILHAAKYPHLAINGVLLAKPQPTGAKGASGARNVDIVDAIPLFHQCLYVTPMVEVALSQIDTFADNEGLQIAGYYVAAENLDDSALDSAPGLAIANKIAENCASAIAVVVDNKALGRIAEKPAIRTFQCAASGDRRSWTNVGDALQIERSAGTLDVVASLVQKSASSDLHDFDNYLDDVQNDWRNVQLNRDVQQLLAMY